MKMKKITEMFAKVTAFFETSDEQTKNAISEKNQSGINEGDKSFLNAINDLDICDENIEEPDLPVEDELDSGDLENGLYRYIECEDHIEIVKYLLDAADVEIPSEIDGKPVTVIKEDAFSGKSLSTLIFHDGVISIGNDAFSYCSNLTSITIPDSVTTIGGCAFLDCSSLTSIIIPNGVTTIGYHAFKGTPWLELQGQPVIVHNILIDYSSASGEVVIPDSVTIVGESVFSWCESLTSITIPNSVTTIGESAFSWCEGLTSIIIPNSVTTIGDDAFFECTSLTSITIPNSVTSIGDSVFKGTPWLELQEQPVIINNILIDYSAANGDVTIPYGVRVIGKGAFQGCSSLTDITIPDSVTTICDNAFSNCSNLVSITIPNSVTTIGYCILGYCFKLTNVNIPENLKDRYTLF